MSDRIAIINKGVIEQLGTPKDIYMHPNSIFAADFIGESNIFEGKVSKATSTTTYVTLDNNLSIGLDSNDYNVGDNVQIVIRPEQIEVLKKKEAGSYLGTVDDIIYMGDYSKLDIDVKGIIFKADVNDVNLYDIGEKVYIKLNTHTIVGIKEK